MNGQGPGAGWEPNRLWFETMKATLLSLALLQFAAPGHGIDPTTIDRSVQPADDLYRFANGKWLEQTKIPSDQPGIDAFYEVHKRTQAKVREIVDEIIKRPNRAPGTIESKVATFYRVFADDARAERLGVRPISPILALCDKPTTPREFIHAAAELDNVGVSALLSTQILNDFHDSRRRMLFFGQANLGLPDPDYYLGDNPSAKGIRGLYQDHVRRTFRLVQSTDAEAEASAKEVLDLETKLASVSLNAEQQRDIQAQYNPVEFKAFAAKYPALDWADYAHVGGLDHLGRVSIAAPKYFERLPDILAQTPAHEVQTYLRWCTLRTYASLLTKAFRDEDFRFQAAITGQNAPTPDDRRYLEGTQAVFGQAIGRMYVNAAFPASAKAKAKQLILNLRSAFAARIRRNEWMTPQTKDQALRKLMAITIKVGYPDKWRSYDKLVVKDDSRVANLQRATQFAHDIAVRDYNKPVDRTEWGMTPQTVNAYYNPMNNEIVFPAAILQRPYFDPDADDASNYGGIGVVIGHEMTHGFDDQGRLFDAKGNLRDWWTKQDEAQFGLLKQKLVEQYNQYKVGDSVPVNGALTVGENIADLGGVHIAYDALQLAMKGKPSETRDGFTSAQRFFLSFAQVFRFKASPQFVALLAKIDAHSPSSLRPAGALVNVPEFVAAFGTPSKDAAIPPASGKLRIW